MNIGVECRAQPPQRLGGEVAGLHPRRAIWSISIYPPGHKSLPEGEDRRRDPHAHRLAPENIKPHEADNKADGAEGHQRANISGAQPPANRVLQSDHHRGVNRQHPRPPLSAKSLLATTSTYCERQEAKAPLTKEASSPEQVKPQQRPVTQQH